MKSLTNIICQLLNIGSTYHCLHHQHSLLPQVSDKLIDVDRLLHLDPLQHGIQCDEGACPAHSSTAVHQQNPLLGIGMGLSYFPDELDHGESIGGHSMVRPGKVVELSHFKRWILPLFNNKSEIKSLIEVKTKINLPIVTFNHRISEELPFLLVSMDSRPPNH